MDAALVHHTHPSAVELKDWQRPTGERAWSWQMPAVVSASSIAFVPPARAASASPFTKPCNACPRQGTLVATMQCRNQLLAIKLLMLPGET